MTRNDTTENKLRRLAIAYGEIAQKLDEAELEEEHEAIRDAIDDLEAAIKDAEEAIEENEDPLEEDEADDE